jgi:hypothetical protein
MEYFHGKDAEHDEQSHDQSCVMRNDGSDCIGATAFSAG